MKHIVLPTDFSIRSLQPIHDVMQHYRTGVLRISMLHLVDLPTGIGDLLFRLRRMDERFPVPGEFLEACEVLANRYEGRITAIRPLIRYGSSALFLDNLLKGIGADAVAIQPGYKEHGPFDESVPLMPLLSRCDCAIIRTTPVTQRAPAHAATVADLLLASS